MLNWTDRFNIFCLLDNNEYAIAHHAHECLLAAGVVKSIQAEPGDAFNQLKDFASRQQDWMFGHFSYDLASETEQVAGSHPEQVRFPALFFFIPEIILELNSDSLRIGSYKSDHHRIFKQITETKIVNGVSSEKKITIQSRFSKEAYLETIHSLRRHILRGDCYEINFCQEFFAEDVTLNPAHTYRLLTETSPAPFASFYRLDDKYLVCASPERYLCREGNHLTSQPIKGTSPRNAGSPGADLQHRDELYRSEKDRSENVMIVDLVRNDLSKICTEGSVTVDELYGIYTFPQVHQMISSVSGEQLPGLHWTDLVKASFPMGSMTGAPKKRVLELIERYEKSGRGLFSGAIGYVDPQGDFDFNVIIRSILYNQSAKYLSYQAGSAITFYSDPLNEYEECLLKASAIKKVLAV